MTSENGQNPMSTINKSMSGMSLGPAGDEGCVLALLSQLQLQLEKMNVTEAREHIDEIENAIKLKSSQPSIIVADIPETQLILIDLNDQESILRWIEEKLDEKAVFHLHVSGSAGTGKSVVLRKVVEMIEEKFGNKSYFVVAPTGVAAINVDGSTIHSAFKLNPYAKNYSDDVNGSFDTTKLVPQTTKVIIIDEISMVDSMLLNRLDRRLKEQKNLESKQPFGGLSVIAFGDLLQLEPVNTDKNTPIPFVFLNVPQSSGFSKDSLKLWDNFLFSELKNNRRTKNEEESKMLEKIRTADKNTDYGKFFEEKDCLMNLGELDDESEKAYREYKKMKKNNPKKQFLIVAATNEVVDRVNDMALFELEPNTKAYKAIETFATTNNYESKVTPYDSSELIPHKKFCRESDKKIETLRINEGSIVMLNCNLDLKSGLANGTIGTVMSCTKDVITINFPGIGLRGIQRELWMLKKGTTTKQFYQYPLRPATAITIHKSQGVTVDGAIIITEDMFGNGSFYTAISRARELKLCRITRFNPNLVKVSQKSKDELDRMRNNKSIFQSE